MRKVALSVLLLGAVLLGGGAAVAADLAVLVAPNDVEWIDVVQAYGFVPATSMSDLLYAYDPNACAIGIAYSGIDLMDHEWLDEFFATGATVVAFGWDLDDLVQTDGEFAPEYDPDLITIAYRFEDTPITYPVSSVQQLDEVLTFACFYAQDWSDFGSLGLDLGEIDLEVLLEEVLQQAGPFLALLDKFLQPEWEYRVEHIIPGDDLSMQLNELGAQGWELVTLSGNDMIFKRRALNAERLIELIFLMAQEALELGQEQGSFF